MTEPSGLPYPAHWEADVVLRDGSTAVVRPIRPDDADRLVAFYARVSERSKYFRFFAPYPRLSARDVALFTEVDHANRVALIVTLGEEMIAVGRYDRIEGDEAEVAFLVEDAHQGRGVGSVLLEHLAQAARENGIGRFRAEVLPANRKMLGVFEEVGYRVTGGFDDGVVGMELVIEPTDTSIEVTRAREHRAEAKSVERILTPRSVAVVGASRSADKIGQILVRNLVAGGFTGPVYAVNPVAAAVAGVPAYPTVLDIPADVDLAIVAVPAESVVETVRQCSSRGVHGVVVVSGGFAETRPAGEQRQRELVRAARAHGMRVIGPNALGIINADPAVSINASLARTVPPPGTVGFFCQSGALGTVILETVARRGLGLSTFLSAGNRADVSGNDAMQYWMEDGGTEVVLLYLESIGNPRKFSRIARRLSRDKPVVAVRSGRATQGVPLGHTVRPPAVAAAAVDAMFEQAGVIRVETSDAMLDVAQILTYQPLPRGNRVRIVGNSDALRLLAVDAVVESGLELAGDPITLPADAGASAFASALGTVVAEPGVDSVVLAYASPVDSSAAAADVAAAIAAATDDREQTVVATFLGSEGVPAPLRRTDERGVAQRGSVPSYSSPETAIRALAKVTEYAAWRTRPVGDVPDPENIDPVRARDAVGRALAGGGETTAGAPETAALLAAYGIDLWPAYPVETVTDAIDAAAHLGWSVVLKATAPHLRQRADFADVRLNLGGPAELRTAWASMVETVGAPEEAGYVVQKMAPPGVPVVIGCTEDQLFGPMVSFGVAGVATELLDDLAYGVPPLTDVEVARLVRSVRAAPLLFGHRGGDHVDVSAVEDLVHRVGRLAYDLPEVVSVELVPALAGRAGVSVLGATVRVAPAPPASRTDRFVRRLTRL